MFIKIPRMYRANATVKQSFLNGHGEEYDVSIMQISQEWDYINVGNIESIYDATHEYFEQDGETPFKLKMVSGEEHLTTKLFIKELLD